MDPETKGEGTEPQDPKGGEPQGQDPQGKAQGGAAGAGEGGTPQDPGTGNTVNRHQYDRDIERRDKEIAELKRQLEEGGKAKKSTDERLAELEKRMAERERELADERANSKLTAAGCVDLDLGRAALAAYDGDVSKLKEAKPYLFKEPDKTQRSTGGRPAGSATDEEQLEHMRRVAGLRKKGA